MNYRTIENDNELIYLIKEENEEALTSLFNNYNSLIIKIARYFKNKYNSLNIDEEDLIQEGKIGLYEAVKIYNMSKDVLFYTFAVFCIKRKMILFLNRNLINKNKILANNMIELDLETIKSDEKEIYNILEEDYLKNKIIEMKNKLDYPDSSIFELKYNGFNYKEIAILLEMNVKQVDNRLQKIRNKLRKYLLEVE